MLKNYEFGVTNYELSANADVELLNMNYSENSEFSEVTPNTGLAPKNFI